MNRSITLSAGTHLLDGPAGTMEVLVNVPSLPQPLGLALMAHPQPLLGGSAQHKIPHFLARAMAEAGWWVVRPNFRGVGQSAGRHDGGEGETDDLLWLIEQLHPSGTDLPLVLAGFSFGAYVQAKVAATLMAQGRTIHSVCLAGMPYGTVESGRTFDTPQGLTQALVLHGEHDRQVPLGLILDWARPSGQMVCVIAGADHFFTGRLPLLRRAILDFLARPRSDVASPQA